MGFPHWYSRACPCDPLSPAIPESSILCGQHPSCRKANYGHMCTIKGHQCSSEFSDGLFSKSHLQCRQIPDANSPWVNDLYRTNATLHHHKPDTWLTNTKLISHCLVVSGLVTVNQSYQPAWAPRSIASSSSTWGREESGIMLTTGELGLRERSLTCWSSSYLNNSCYCSSFSLCCYCWGTGSGSGSLWTALGTLFTTPPIPQGQGYACHGCHSPFIPLLHRHTAGHGAVSDQLHSYGWAATAIAQTPGGGGPTKLAPWAGALLIAQP